MKKWGPGEGVNDKSPDDATTTSANCSMRDIDKDSTTNDPNFLTPN